MIRLRGLFEPNFNRGLYFCALGDLIPIEKTTGVVNQLYELSESEQIALIEAPLCETENREFHILIGYAV
jgi:hypothetical protein